MQFAASHRNDVSRLDEPWSLYGLTVEKGPVRAVQVRHGQPDAAIRGNDIDAHMATRHAVIIHAQMRLCRAPNRCRVPDLQFFILCRCTDANDMNEQRCAPGAFHQRRACCLLRRLGRAFLAGILQPWVLNELQQIAKGRFEAGLKIDVLQRAQSQVQIDRSATAHQDRDNSPRHVFHRPVGLRLHPLGTLRIRRHHHSEPVRCGQRGPNLLLPVGRRLEICG